MSIRILGRSAAVAAMVLAAQLVALRAVAQSGAAERRVAQYNGDAGATKYSPLDQIDKTTSRGCRSRGAARRSTPSSRAAPQMRPGRQLPQHAAHDRRRAVRAERRRLRRGVRPRHRPDALGRAAVRAGRTAIGGARRAASRTGPTATTRGSSCSTAISVRAQRRHRQPIPTLRHERPRVPIEGLGPTCATRGPARRSSSATSSCSACRRSTSSRTRKPRAATCAPTTCARAGCAGSST